jgi:hypothetical protein
MAHSEHPPGLGANAVFTPTAINTVQVYDGTTDPKCLAESHSADS